MWWMSPNKTRNLHVLHIISDVSKRQATAQRRTFVKCIDCKKEISSKYLREHLKRHHWSEHKIHGFCGSVYKRETKMGAHECPACKKVVSWEQHVHCFSSSTVIFCRRLVTCDIIEGGVPNAKIASNVPNDGAEENVSLQFCTLSSWWGLHCYTHKLAHHINNVFALGIWFLQLAISLFRYMYIHKLPSYAKLSFWI